MSYFSSSLKLQHCRTLILLPWLHNNTARFPDKKRWHSPPPRRVASGLPSPFPSSDGRSYAGTHNKIFRLGSIGYQICLPGHRELHYKPFIKNIKKTITIWFIWDLIHHCMQSSLFGAVVYVHIWYFLIWKDHVLLDEETPSWMED